MRKLYNTPDALRALSMSRAHVGKTMEMHFALQDAAAEIERLTKERDAAQGTADDMYKRLVTTTGKNDLRGNGK